MDEAEKAVTRLKAAFGETIIGDLAKKAFEALGGAANYVASSIERATKAERARKAGGGTPEQQELLARERLLVVSDNLKTLWTDYYRLKAQGETSATAAVKNTINGLEEEKDNLGSVDWKVEE
ncbi:hypothetical protein [Treponema endosymbiont of Eucomonympha sp.]|uniref:hypothetical protein n=1 Tax=Treponema endosymbiont of Eucomonympha sp. TaxID=1580831 RepID=UPI0016507AE6|nr:hypothetical protein [Treponema endosymbiont of Eucomonympha sp.]